MWRPSIGLLRRRSLRTRFGVWVAALIVLALSLFGAYVYVAVGLGLRKTLDDSLRVSASLVASTVSVTRDGLVLGESMPENNTDLQALLAQGNTVRYIDARGAVLGGFGHLWDAPPETTGLLLARSGTPAFTNSTDPVADKDYRVFSLPLTDSHTVVGFVQVMHNLDSIDGPLQRLLTALLAGGAVLMVLVGLGGYVLAGRALAPIDAITRTARRISAQDLSARLHFSGADDEVGRLARTFDDMLERLDDSFKRERRFAADASHELRTPLAAMEAILGVIRSESRDPGEYASALDDLAEETARLRALVADLLEFARGTRPGAADLAPVDLATLVTDVTDVLRPLAEAKELSLDGRLGPALTVRGDRDGLVRVFVNLVDNAITFTTQGGVMLSGSSAGDEVRVTVTDTGIGIPADRLPHVFEPFYRVDPSRSAPGTGLGLALARQIVHDHGGTLTVRSVVGQGTTFTVGLPSAPAGTD